MVTYNKRCAICQHPRMAEIHLDYLKHKMKKVEIIQKYFPGRKKASLSASLLTHFDKHYNLEANLDVVSDAALVPANPRDPSIISDTDRQVFQQLARERIDAIATVETMMQILMTKINFLESTWNDINRQSACEKCGSSSLDNAPVLKMLLECIKELRELSERWVKFRDPMETMRAYFSKTFSEYTNQMVRLYVGILQDKSRQLQDSVNQFLKGEIIASVFARRIADFQDMEVTKISQESSTIFKRLLSEVLKEFK